MTDYASLKVAELKDELKKRGIPTTNLTRKQQIVDRLTEHDAQTGSSVEAPALPPALEESDAVADAPDPVEPSSLGSAASAQHDTSEPDHERRSASDLLGDAPVPVETEAIARAETSAAPDVAPAALAAEGQHVSEGDKEDNPTPVPEGPPTVDATPLQESATVGEHTIEITPESRKRKRRSATPPVSQDSVNKKLRRTDEDVVHLEKDEVFGETRSEHPEHKPDADMSGLVEHPNVTDQPVTGAHDAMNTSDSAPSTQQFAARATASEAEAEAEADSMPPKTNRSPNERRFKDLIHPSMNSEQDTSLAHAEPDLDVEISPALHPATRALYIRELIRPINPGQLRDHLEHLATPPDRSSPGDIIEDYYIDALRTHAFVLFASISAASRVRASVHARVWPPEPTRKPLWADFVPENRFREWIERERASGGSRPSQAKKWEVSYDAAGDRIEARLVEATPSGPGGQRPSFSGGVPGAPTGPRGSIPALRRPSFPAIEPRRHSQPLAAPRRSTAKAVEDTSASFLELDKLFRFTATKPKLYWQPVGDDLADKRLDELDRETSRDWDPRLDAQRNGDSLGRGLDALKRYTFEDGDVLVDGGPEYGGGRAFDRGIDGYRGRGGPRRGGGGGGDRYR
ncbi:hypothetical protein MBLNU459_g7463t1 [Dothideomycetes sp. NU459]